MKIANFTKQCKDKIAHQLAFVDDVKYDHFSPASEMCEIFLKMTDAKDQALFKC
jgi:hypothetical protein